MLKFTRKWAMPSPDTFTIPPIQEFVRRWLNGRKVIVDPFARNSLIATHRNDLNRDTNATHHLEAVEFLRLLKSQGVAADAALIDPPYSPRQMAECYQSAGLKKGRAASQNAKLLSEVRTAIREIMSPGGVVLSFGWSSTGMGKKHGFQTAEILLVPHGGAHNDTICLAETPLTR